MATISTEGTAIKFGSSLRIGYRPYGSLVPFTYIGYFPSFNELPYNFTIPSPGLWEIEYTEICQACSGANYSDPATTVITVY